MSFDFMIHYTEKAVLEVPSHCRLCNYGAQFEAKIAQKRLFMQFHAFFRGNNCTDIITWASNTVELYDFSNHFINAP